MKKIPTIFERDGKHLTHIWTPETRWASSGLTVRAGVARGVWRDPPFTVSR